MKKLTLVFVLTFIFQAISFSQPCLPDGIVFSTQLEIDNFQVNYPNCTEIEGDVLIKGDDITNLNGLNVITTIDGNLYVGDLSWGNPALTSLTGLDNLTNIGGDLYIRENSALTSLSGLDNLTYIEGYLTIIFNNSLASLTGLENLTTTERLEIIGNDALPNLTGLNNVTSIGDYLFISDNNTMSSLTGLEGLTSIGGLLEIKMNDVLISLTGLDNIDASSINQLRIYENNSLSTCEVQSICDYLAAPGGTIEIHDNALGCNSQQEVEEACETVSINEFNDNLNVSVYPNPVSNFFNVLINDFNGVAIVSIYNQLGRIVLKEKIMSSRIDISELSKGVYILELKSDNHLSRHKLVKE